MKRGDTPAGGYQVKSFIVRLSHHPEGFSAEVRPLTGGRNQTFNSLEQLFAYLQDQARQDRSS